MKRAFTMKSKALFIIYKMLSLKQIKEFFLEVESSALISLSTNGVRIISVRKWLYLTAYDMLLRYIYMYTHTQTHTYIHTHMGKSRGPRIDSCSTLQETHTGKKNLFPKLTKKVTFMRKDFCKRISWSVSIMPVIKKFSKPFRILSLKRRDISGMIFAK